MPAFKYVGEDERVYPSLGLTVAPGDEVLADDNPDEARFTKATGKAKSPAPAPDDAPGAAG